MARRQATSCLSLGFFLWVLAGCTTIGAPTAQEAYSETNARRPAPVEDRNNVEAVVRRLAFLSAQTPAALQQAKAVARTNFDKAGDPGSRLELAWLLAQPGTDFQNRALANKLLDDYLESTESTSSFAALATLMRAELRQQDRRIKALALARDQLATASSRKLELEVQIDTLTGLLETLQQQFEELKEIERQVN